MDPVFSLKNPAAICAGLSCVWLLDSLKLGSPKETWKLGDEIRGVRYHRELPNSSIDRLAHLGLKMGATTKKTDCSAGVMAAAITSATGPWLYITFKSNKGIHAMAGYKSKSHIYIFEPQLGLYKWDIKTAPLSFLRDYTDIYNKLGDASVAFKATTVKVYSISGRKAPQLRQVQRLPTQYN